MAVQPNQPSTNALQRAQHWWAEAKQRWSRVYDMSTMSPHEIERISHEVGLTPDEFLELASRPDRTELLIERRLAALQLDPEGIRTLAPLLLADIQRTCALCTEKSRCADEMADDPLAPGWESYCPNAGTLSVLR